MIKTYKDLIVWQKSIRLIKEIYIATKLFPKDELYGLVSQMRRSAISIASNIAEGRCRGTRKDFTQFLRIALGSSAELETQIIIAHELGYVDLKLKTRLIDELSEILKILNTMIKKLTAES